MTAQTEAMASPPAVDPLDFRPPYPAGEPRFAPAQPVRVKALDGPGHLRTPWYLRGRVGRVERICGAFPIPEELAYGRAAPARPLYRVRFAMAELWGHGTEAAAQGGDTLDAEIFEHWLEPVE